MKKFFRSELTCIVAIVGFVVACFLYAFARYELLGDPVRVASFGTNYAPLVLIAGKVTPLPSTDGIVVSAGQVQVGPTAIAADQQVLVTDGAPTLTGQVWFQTDDAGHVGTGGNNEEINVVIRNNTAFDTTANAGHASGIDVIADATIGVPGNALTNTAIAANASCPGGGSCTAFDYNSQFGIMRHDGPINFDSSPDVQLGVFVENFSVVPQAPLATTPQVDIGKAFSTDGYNLHTINTATGVANGGLFVQLDPTPDSGIRGGLTVDRNASATANNAGIIIAGGSGDPWIDSNANEWSMYSEIGPIKFGTDQSFTSADVYLSVNGHWVQDVSRGPPSVDGVCSAAGTTIVGNDNGFQVTTGGASTSCTFTFAKTWTLLPLCSITPVGQPVVPTCTPTATTVVCPTMLGSQVYTFSCQGRPGAT